MLNILLNVLRGKVVVLLALTCCGEKEPFDYFVGKPVYYQHHADEGLCFDHDVVHAGMQAANEISGLPDMYEVLGTGVDYIYLVSYKRLNPTPETSIRGYYVNNPLERLLVIAVDERMPRHDFARSFVHELLHAYECEYLGVRLTKQFIEAYRHGPPFFGAGDDSIEGRTRSILIESGLWGDKQSTAACGGS